MWRIFTPLGKAFHTFVCANSLPPKRANQDINKIIVPLFELRSNAPASSSHFSLARELPFPADAPTTLCPLPTSMATAHTLSYAIKVPVHANVKRASMPPVAARLQARAYPARAPTTPEVRRVTSSRRAMGAFFSLSRVRCALTEPRGFF